MLISLVGFSEEVYIDLAEAPSLPKDAINTGFISCLLSLINSILKNPQAERYGRLLILLLRDFGEDYSFVYCGIALPPKGNTQTHDCLHAQPYQKISNRTISGVLPPPHVRCSRPACKSP